MVVHPVPEEFAPNKPPRRLWLYILVAAISFGAGMSTALAEANGPVGPSEGPTQVCQRALEGASEAIELAFQYLSTDPSQQAVLGSLDAQMAALAEDPRVTQDAPECLAY
jgi:hypothetical protein